MMHNLTKCAKILSLRLMKKKVKRKKSLYQKLTRISRSRQKSEKPVYQMFRGIEAKIEYHRFLDDWGNLYQSILRSALNDFQKGIPELDIERTYQKRFNIQWAWADSITTSAKGIYEQLISSKENKIEELKIDISSGWEKVRAKIEKLEDALNNPTSDSLKNFDNKLLGLNSKIERLIRLKKRLVSLQKQERLHICFGKKKLFKAQYHLTENGYDSHQEWLEDWRKARGGNFTSIGKGSADGNNLMTSIHYLGDNQFSVTIKIPRILQSIYGEKITLPFELNGTRKHDLLYSLEANKPVTVQIFRREEKNDQWYIHLSTYVPAVPTISSKKNGCLGIDLNANSIDLVYVKPDGNLHKVGANGRSPLQGKFTTASYAIPTGTKGQVNAKLRDIIVEIVRMAEEYQCPIAVEDLDFAKKKATMRHQSKRYNRMLSGFIYDKFRACLMARAQKYGIGVIFKNPFATSVIGMIKYMPRYGLNSATAAAMVIARRALGFSEKIPKSFLPLIGVKIPEGKLPEDGFPSKWRLWADLCSLLNEHSITRHQLFDLTKVCEVLRVAVSQSPPHKKRGRRRKVSSAST